MFWLSCDMQVDYLGSLVKMGLEPKVRPSVNQLGSHIRKLVNCKTSCTCTHTLPLIFPFFHSPCSLPPRESSIYRESIHHRRRCLLSDGVYHYLQFFSILSFFWCVLCALRCTSILGSHLYYRHLCLRLVDWKTARSSQPSWGSLHYRLSIWLLPFASYSTSSCLLLEWKLQVG